MRVLGISIWLLLITGFQQVQAQFFGDTVCVGVEKLYTVPPGYNYTWLVNNGIPLSPTNQDNISVRWNAVGTGSLKCVRTNQRSCFSDTVSMLVLVLPVQSASIAGVDKVCAGKVYFYQPQGGATWLDGTSTRKAISFHGDTMLYARVVRPCGVDTIQKYITVFAQPNVDFEILTAEPEVGLPLEVVMHDPTLAANSRWTLMGDDTLTTTGSPAVFIPNLYGKSRIRLVTVNGAGCADSAFKDIQIADNRRCYIPNSFTPNLDDKNQLFKPTTTGATWVRIEIFNTWGQMIYVEEGDNPGWDGTWNEKVVPSGVYVYAIYVKFNNVERKYIHQGTLHLVY